jgi:CRISPR-associated protein Cse1 (CRISPR_cse1)
LLTTKILAGPTPARSHSPGVDVYGSSGDAMVECFTHGTEHFSLVAEPWIPLLTTSGMQTGDLARAFDPDVICIATGDDLEDIALTRLLLAIHIAAADVEQSPRDWLDTHRARFNLFDPHRPFWQNADMARFAHMSGAVRPLVSASYRHAGRGSTAVNVWHNESGLVFDSAAVARLLVVRQQFSVGGKQPFITAAYGPAPIAAKMSVATNRPFLWLDDGRLASSLAATAAFAGTHPVGRFWFTWPEHTPPAASGTPSGVLDGLTWPSRSMLVIRGNDSSESGIMVCEGLRWPEFRSDSANSEAKLVPHTVYARTPDSTQYAPQRVHPDRPAWHQLAVMCADPDYPRAAVPGATSSAGARRRWRLGGIGAYQAAISGAVTACFPVPMDPLGLAEVLADMTRAYQRIGSVTAELADAISPFAGYRSVIPTHTGLSVEFEAIAARVASGEISAANGSQLVASTAESVTKSAYLSVARIRPIAAARVAAHKAHSAAREVKSP